MKKLVVLTGAGISAESGLMTFRDAGGLWENHRIEDVATPEGWRKNPTLVLKFYNERRAKAFEAQPNTGHMTLVELEKYFDVQIITQNVDNLHEKAGSTKVLHLHGELTKVRSMKDETLVEDIGHTSIALGDLAADGGQFRPHIVWFGEMVPMIEHASELSMEADIFVVVGTSLQVYPAAGLVSFVRDKTPIFIIDPKSPDISSRYKNVSFISETATVGVPQLAALLIRDYQ